MLVSQICCFAITGTVPLTHRPHILSGDYDGIWECHIKADWLLLWIVTDKTVTILRTGTHSDLF
ncbi:MAG: type II toxin-antitoxin system YafQ family toxin [Bacteroidales bacterium]|nr:type II toxin-antitoxin system YafQ family toxin [Bacteroidales bacterium]